MLAVNLLARTKCGGCCRLKPVPEFRAYNRCLACRRKKQTTWRLMNPAAARAIAGRHYVKHRAAEIERGRDHKLRAKFGISAAEYDELFAGQGGACAICRRSDNNAGDSRRMPVDHDHATGAVRGILCSECNIGVGKFLDAPSLLRAAAVYLERKAVMTGRPQERLEKPIPEHKDGGQ